MKIFKFFFCVIGCELVGLISTPLTISSIPTWYATLTKPFFSPSSWIFGPVWTILYFLMGISAYLVWIKGKNKKIDTALKFFLAQLFLNFLWTPLFFGLHLPIMGLIDIILMWILIVITMQKFNKISKPAFYLLIPYLVWVSFATILNAAIVILN